MNKTDSRLQQYVLDELRWEPSVDHEHIGVAVNGGVVTLSGTVNSYSEKVNAEQAARRVAGVRAIAENLEVRYPYQAKTGDSEIAKRISDVLSWDPLVPDGKLEITVEKGVVKLDGHVDWNYQRDLAFKAASKIGGVVRIDNRIAVDSSRASPDEIRKNIEQAFDRQAELEADKIDIRTEGHTVTLSGTVNSYNKRTAAENAAWRVPGVASVKDNIIVA